MENHGPIETLKIPEKKSSTVADLKIQQSGVQPS